MKLVTVPTAIFVLNISNMKLTSITYIDEKILDQIGYRAWILRAPNFTAFGVSKTKVFYC